MQLKVYSSPSIYWEHVSPQLILEPSKNCLILGLSKAFCEKPDNCLYQGALFNEDRLVAALIANKYRSKVNVLPSPVSDRNAAESLLTSLISNGISFDGLLAESNSCDLYRQLLSDRDFETMVHVDQGIYRCREVKLPTFPSDLNFRQAESRDCKVIGKWIESFQQEAVPHDPLASGLEIAKTKIEQGLIFVLERDSELLSMAAWSRDIGCTCSVSLVYTPKKLRKSGYASTVTAKLTKLLLGDGKDEVNLFTDLSNSTSNRIYQNIGFQKVCEFRHLGIANL